MLNNTISRLLRRICGLIIAAFTIATTVHSPMAFAQKNSADKLRYNDKLSYSDRLKPEHIQQIKKMGKVRSADRLKSSDKLKHQDRLRVKQDRLKHGIGN